ncbi:MAG: lipopolysaccharide heptosyltransferase II [Victivallaceae bacterium]|nr:lipopolysaccharide heptosyltransferase II [Victivallaceae bacterium]
MKSNRFIDLVKEFPAPKLESVKIPVGAWRNGLVVRMPNHLGDAVMALPALRQLKSLLPDFCALFVIAPSAQRQLYEALSEVDCFLPLSRPHKVWSFQELNNLRGMRPGIGVLFNNSLRDAVMMRVAGVKQLYGAAARGRSIFLSHAFNLPPRPGKGELARIHQTAKCLAIVEALGAKREDAKMPKFKITPPVDEIRSRITAIAAHPSLLTIAPGAAFGSAKRWPAEYFRATAEYWLSHGGAVAAVGGKAEFGIAAEALRGLPTSRTFNLAGDTDLAELMHILHSSRAVVANDSGVMHLAAAIGTPGVAIFGSTDYTATGPVSNRWAMLYEKDKCSPCYEHMCPSGAFCSGIMRITPEMVIGALVDLTGCK